MKNTGLYRRTFRFLRPHLPLFALSSALSIGIVGLESLTVWLIAPLSRTLFTPGANAPSRPDVSIANAYDLLKYHTYEYLSGIDPVVALKIVCIVLVAAVAAKNAVIYVKNILVALVRLRVERDLRGELYQHALCLPVTYYDRNSSSSVISLVVRDVTAFNASMTGTLDKLILEPMRVLVFIGIMTMVSPRLALAVILVLPVLTACIGAIGKAVRRRSKRVLEKFAGIVAILNETVGGIRTVKLFGMESTEGHKFNAENNQYVHRSLRSVRIERLAGPITETLGAVVASALLWYGGREVLAGGGLDPEDFLVMLGLVFSCFKPLKALASVNSRLQAGFAAAERVYGVLDAPPESERERIPSTAPDFGSAVTFDNVCFTYPGTTDQVLDSVSFSLQRGQVVALVGPSGSGKSTILDLLPRFYDVSSGRITLDGTDLRDFPLSGLRQMFGIVAQETVLFNDSVFNNIAYGCSAAAEESVLACAQAANALEFIEKLPDGMQSRVGERGVMLSGGQRQRLAIARALLRNPPVLILDEATSALDTESERLVQSAISRLMENRTALVVAHRLSTVRDADLILVIDDGRIVERGRHDELLAQDGRYRALHDLQFSTDSNADQ